MLKRFLVAALALVVASTALAVPPELTIVPTPDADGIPDGGSPSPTFEVVFTGPTASVTVTPSGGSGTGQANTSTFICPSLTGDAQIEKAPGAGFFEGATITPLTIVLNCNPGGASRAAVLTCNSKLGNAAATTFRWDISCPVGGPEFSSSPLAGTALPISTTPAADGSAVLAVSNSGAAALSVTSIGGLASPITVSPPSAVIGAGDMQPFTITCNSAVPGVYSQNLVVNTNDSDEPAVNFGVDCTVVAPEFSASAIPGGMLPALNAAQGGAAPTTTVTVTNLGNAAMLLGPVTGLSAPLSAQFDTSTVATSASATLTVGCATDTAQSVGPQLLSFTTNDPDDGEGTISFLAACTITPPTSAEFAPSAAPGPLPLITTTQGTNGTRTVTINNAGDAPLTLGAITGQTATITAAFSPAGPVGIGGMTTLTITCNAAAAGSFGPAFLSFTTNDPDDGEASIGYTIACEVAAPASPEFSPSPAAPGPIAITTTQGTNASGALTVTNIGTATLQVTGITGPAGPKISLVPPALPIAVAPMTSIVLTLNCDASTAAGSPFNDTITLATNDASEGSVPFNVSCTVAAPPPPDVDATPPPPGPIGITTLVNETSTGGISFRNRGASTLEITSVSGLAAPFTAIGLPRSIPPDGDASIKIECLSGVTGFFSDTFTVNTNDPDEGTLAYNATCRVLSNEPEFDSFPPAGAMLSIDTIAGESGATFLFLSNLGAKPLGVTAQLITSPPPAPPSPLSISYTQTTIAPGFGATLSISCTPSAEGSYLGTLRLVHDDSGESPANYDINCFARPDTRASFRVLVSGGVFTAGKTEKLFRDGFE